MKCTWKDKEIALIVIGRDHGVTFSKIANYLGRKVGSIQNIHYRYTHEKFPLERTDAINTTVIELSSSWCNIVEDITDAPTNTNTSCALFLLGSRPSNSSGSYVLAKQVLTEDEAIKRIESSNVDTIAFELVPTKLEVTTTVVKKLVTINK